MIFSQGCARQTELLIAKKWYSECLCGLPDTLSTSLNIQCLEFVFSRWCLGHCGVSGGLWYWLIFIFACTSTILSIYELLHLSMLYSKNAALPHSTVWILQGFSWKRCDANVKIVLRILKLFFAVYQSILFSVLNSWGSVDCNLSEITTSRLGEP